MTYEDGSSYNGNWSLDKYEGDGILTSPDGEAFIGKFKNGKKDGRDN